MIESFWSTMQRELIDTQSWATRTELAAAIFEWIETWYNPPPPPHVPGRPVPGRVRSPSHRHGHHGIINPPELSGNPGPARGCPGTRGT